MTLLLGIPSALQLAIYGLNQGSRFYLCQKLFCYLEVFEELWALIDSMFWQRMSVGLGPFSKSWTKAAPSFAFTPDKSFSACCLSTSYTRPTSSCFSPVGLPCRQHATWSEGVAQIFTPTNTSLPLRVWGPFEWWAAQWPVIVPMPNKGQEGV